tara:strand:- start:5796 stop:6386 length:591 start_codon:yes stop_codon:yes gene_type:complete
MNKKVIIQFLLLVILLSIITSVFLIYFKEDENQTKAKIELEETLNSEINEETGTLIKDLNYSFSDPSGNYYKLFAEIGIVDINNSDKMLLTNVKASIYLKNSAPIEIESKYANYDKSNHETNFFDDVRMTHLIHKANSKNLDISFENNLATMYNEIIYKKPGTKMTADRLEIDLITKNTKIFMDNKSEKIKIIDKE